MTHTIPNKVGSNITFSIVGKKNKCMAAILCIDDDPDILNIQRALLGHKDCTVLTAADGVTGIALARKHHIDVVVLDFSMPGMDSHQVAQVLMKDDPTLPVVM